MNYSTEELNKLSIRELINLYSKIGKLVEAKKRENWKEQDNYCDDYNRY